MKSKRIFVYGSLMEGFYNYDKFLKGQILNKVSRAFISGKLFHLPKGYPAVIPGKDNVVGEVFDVVDDGKILEDLDRLEGFISRGNPNNLYNVEMMEVALLDGTTEILPVYIYNSTEDEIIDSDSGVYLPGGDWKLFMTNKG